MEKTFLCVRCGIKDNLRSARQKYCAKCNGPATRERAAENEKKRRREKELKGSVLQ